MSDEVHSRLRRLGVVRGTRNLKAASKKLLNSDREDLSSKELGLDLDQYPDENLPLEVLVPGGHLVGTDVGSCFVVDSVYPVDQLHGADRLQALFGLPLSIAASIAGDERLATMEYKDLLFLDTETTGLFGAGTLAFMVGVGFFDNNRKFDIEGQENGDSGQGAFVVRQFFLRDHGDEPAMLKMLAALLKERPGVVTFNGRTFDLPLLDGRYLINRLDDLVGDLRFLPHLDLLPPSRRLWRRRLGSCALGSLETNLLGLARTHQDVPGWAIPGLYLDYLRNGDARPLMRVFYHNRIDMLSMVTLMSRILRQVEYPVNDDPAEDLLSLARWQLKMGNTADAEKNLRMVIDRQTSLDIYHRSLYALGLLLKRYGKREEAVQYWQQLVFTYVRDEQTSKEALDAHVELAKYYEWHSIEIRTALQWTRQALDLLNGLALDKLERLRPDLDHRLARLERKLN